MADADLFTLDDWRETVDRSVETIRTERHPNPHAMCEDCGQLFLASDTVDALRCVGCGGTGKQMHVHYNWSARVVDACDHVKRRLGGRAG